MRNLLERSLVEHCSATLACIKSASLFTQVFSCDGVARATVEYWRNSLRTKGVEIDILRLKQGHALIYVYRPQLLEYDLSFPGTRLFLSKCGYTASSVREIIDQLKEKLAESETFPHEIGIFLGYPLGDVVGFIRNNGQNCKCTGCWKVYCDECKAEKTFAKIKKCRDNFLTLYSRGYSVQQLTAAV